MTQDKATRQKPNRRDSYSTYRPISTRWMDNDVYGHVNNVIYYSWFDTVVNAYLIEKGVLDIHNGQAIGLVVETQCHYFSSLAFPEIIEAGIRVAYLGKSSARFEIGIFAKNSTIASAQGYFVHVYVDKVTRRPVALPPNLKLILEKLV